MYYAFPSNTSIQTLVQKMKQLSQSYVFVMFTFSGSYASMMTKQRYVQMRLHEKIPLFIIDVRQCSQLYQHFAHLFPKLFMQKKLPLHVCFKKIASPHLQLQPVMCNAAIMGDRHLQQLQLLLQEDQLEKEQRVITA